jgi:tRNA threonylcarbamoyl adenosine modification protein YeaZ
VTVIAIDSASRVTAWALLTTAKGEVLGKRDVPGGDLDRFLPGVLADLLTGEVAAIVTLTGPGSYSGVRAGMAAALGLAAARRLPLHGLGNLVALAGAAPVADTAAFSVVSDAGRGGVYLARFTRQGARLNAVSAVERVDAGAVDTAGRVFATTAIAGLHSELLDPTQVLAAAVPRALALAPLDALGLTAIHAEPAATDR